MNFLTLTKYELKKILIRKSTWITFALLTLFYCVQLFFTWGPPGDITSSSTSVDENGQEIENSFTEPYRDYMARTEKNCLALSGRKLDDSLLKEMREWYASLDEKEDISFEDYNRDMERYKLAEYAITRMTGITDPSLIKNLTEEDLYRQRGNLIAETAKDYRLTDSEKAYWAKKDAALEKPFVLRYCGFYENPSCIYMALLMTCFLISITVSRIFTEEHARKTDQIILCTKSGKNRLYYAKVLAGSIVTFAATLFFTLFTVLADRILYGPYGADAMVWQLAGWYSYPLTLGQTLGILILLEFLSAIMTSFLAMTLSELFSSSLLTMAAILAGLFISRLFVIPHSLRALSQIWNYIPINLVNLNEGLLDPRLVSLPGIHLTNWQFAPFSYLFLSVVFFLIGKIKYEHYQAGGI